MEDGVRATYGANNTDEFSLRFYIHNKRSVVLW
jgi:hypothetical protein